MCVCVCVVQTGLDSPLLLLYGERAVQARAKALADAERHRRHMEAVSEAMAQHGKDEAEATLKVCIIRDVWSEGGRKRERGRELAIIIHPSSTPGVESRVSHRSWHGQAGLDSVREQLVEERVHELRRCEESLKAGADGAWIG